MNQNLRSTARLFQSGLFVFWLVFAAADLGAAASVPVTVRFDFSSQEKVDQRWRVNGELPGVNATRFRVEPDDSGNGQVLVVEANRATGILITLPREIDLRKTPWVRWRWRVTRPLTIPEGAAEPDDQALVIYLGDGNFFSKRSLAYRWEARTEVGSEGRCRYGAGTVRIKHFCLRNRDTVTGEWVTEERNALQDFKEAFDDAPGRNFAVGIGANTQNTRANTRAELDYIEFSSHPLEAIQQSAPAGGGE